MSLNEFRTWSGVYLAGPLGHFKIFGLDGCRLGVYKIQDFIQAGNVHLEYYAH